MTRVNLLTGFLGSGKTTTLLHLLAHKPQNENWAVLVNEFGEIGIDGALLANRGATLKEIPGGCMCCVNGLPMQVGLNRLLQQNKPDRLLIEPTGLGHPRQLLQMLTSSVYQPWIELQATLTLLDARQLADVRVTENENFRDQLAAADIIAAINATAGARPIGSASWRGLPPIRTIVNLLLPSSVRFPWRYLTVRAGNRAPFRIRSTIITLRPRAAVSQPCDSTGARHGVGR